jgi:hypothetical protein
MQRIFCATESQKTTLILAGAFVSSGSSFADIWVSQFKMSKC